MLDPIWLKVMLASLPIGYGIGSALVVVLWKLNKSMLALQLDNHTTKLMVRSLIQNHAKRHKGEGDELLNWFGDSGPNWQKQES